MVPGKKFQKRPMGFSHARTKIFESSQACAKFVQRFYNEIELFMKKNSILHSNDTMP